jgi:hypothetical protein
MNSHRHSGSHMPSVRWPQGYEPSGAALHAVNSGRTAAASEAVWAWLVRPELWSSFYVNARRVRHQSGPWPQVALGSRFTWITFGAVATTEIVEYEPFERLAWTATGLGARAHHAWVLTPRADGGTDILTEETQRGRAPALLRRALAPAMHYMHQRWINGLASSAEGRQPP